MTGDYALQEALDKEPSVVFRLVSVLAVAPWQIEQLKRLLPPDISSHGPLNGQPNTLMITAPDFVTLGPDAVFERVDSLMRNLTSILNVYAPNARWDFHTGQIHDKLATGQNRACARFSLPVHEFDPMAMLAESIGAESRLQRLHRLSREDEDVTHAFELLQRPDPLWSDVYHVLEFLEKTVKATVTKSQIFREHRQTANHFRHLGRKGQYPLPKDPPKLDQSRQYAARLLRGWLEQRIAKSG